MLDQGVLGLLAISCPEGSCEWGEGGCGQLPLFLSPTSHCRTLGRSRIRVAAPQAHSAVVLHQTFVDTVAAAEQQHALSAASLAVLCMLRDLHGVCAVGDWAADLLEGGYLTGERETGQPNFGEGRCLPAAAAAGAAAGSTAGSLSTGAI